MTSDAAYGSVGRREDDADLLLALLDASPGLVLLLDAELSVTWVNRATADLFGYEPEETLGRSILEFLDPDWNPVAFDSIASALGGSGLRAPMTFRVISKDGRRTIIEAQANVQFDNDVLQGLVAYARPWTERWLLDKVLDAIASNEPASTALDLLVQVAASETLEAEAAFLFDPDPNGRVAGIVASERLEPVLAGPSVDARPELVDSWQALMANSEGQVVDTDELPELLRLAAIERGFTTLWLWPSQHVVNDPARAWAIAWRSEPHLDTDETRREMMQRLATLSGLIIERAHQDKARTYASTHDALTGLLNRSAFFDELAALFEQPASSPIGLLYLDLDRFKPVNDAYGHSAGDRVLEEIATRLASAVPAQTIISRIGGDEFAVAAQGTSVFQLEALAHRLVSAASQPVTLRSGEQVAVGASVGIATAASGDTTTAAADLIDAADNALYTAKRTGANVHVASQEGLLAQPSETREGSL